MKGDILAALRFVRPLLASFGGDKEKVTLFGQSSGGTNILALLASSKSKGLFRGAISLSGSPNITASVEQTSDLHGRYLIPTTGCGNKNVTELKSCLLKQSAYNLTYSMQPITGNPPTVNPPNLPFSPSGNNLIGLTIVDGYIVEKPVLQAVSEPIVDVSLIVQNVQCEQDPSKWEVDQYTNTTAYQQFLKEHFSSHVSHFFLFLLLRDSKTLLNFLQ